MIACGSPPNPVHLSGDPLLVFCAVAVGELGRDVHRALAKNVLIDSPFSIPSFQASDKMKLITGWKWATSRRAGSV